MSGSLVQSVDWFALAPPLVVAVAALVVLLLDLLVPGRVALVRGVALAGVVVAAGWLVAQVVGDPRATFCTATTGDLVSCSYVAEPLTWALQAIALGGAAIVLLIPDRRPRPLGEYHFLLLVSLTGAMTLAAARDLMTLLVALELLSLPAFAMIALPTWRAEIDGVSAEGAFKAFVVSVTSFAVMLVGAALLYGATGTLFLDGIAQSLVAGPADVRVAAVGATLVLAGLLFKVAAVPFHGWVPDAYTGSSVRVAAYLSSVSKTGGIAGLLVVLTVGLRPYGHVWGTALAIIATLTMTVGNLGALRQTDPVRLLAWSSIAQSGFVLVPLAAAGVTSGARGVWLDGAAASIAYLAVYVAVNLGAFAVVALIGRGPITESVGLVRTRPFAAIALGFFLLNLAGLPPGIAGLVTKVVVTRSAVDSGLGWLAMVMAVNIVVGLAYYLRWTVILFDVRSEDARGERPVAPGSAAPRVALVAVGLALAVGVVLSVWPEFVLAVL